MRTNNTSVQIDELQEAEPEQPQQQEPKVQMEHTTGNSQEEEQVK